MTQNAQFSADIYRALDTSGQQIRLLTVSQNLTKGFVDCRLSTHNLSTARYVVLSYQWGTADTTHQILLNGQPFYVRTNLFGFLNVIREQHDMLLWIDALCINQRDLLERNSQVRIMGSIFRGAAMVLSWLGEGTDDVRRAFGLMDRVWGLDVVQGVGAGGGGVEDERLPGLGEGETEDDLWRCVEVLCRLPYWNRVWVVQEVLLSSNNYLLCGNQTLTWQVFANFMSLVGVRFTCPGHRAKFINECTARSYAMSKPYVMVPQRMQWSIGNDLIHDYGKGWDTREYNLFRILTMFGDRDCTDPLDHIYALLSLTLEGKGFPISYGIDRVQLLLTTFHFCGQSVAEEHGMSDFLEVYRPASQRALMRNARFLAEILEIVQSQQRTLPYLHGASVSGRGPSPRPDPCFPCPNQAILLQCTAITPGNEPPVLRSNTLRRNLSAIPFDTVWHLNESNSWFLCMWPQENAPASIAGVITIKDGPQGRGFRILEPGAMAKAIITPPASALEAEVCKMLVPAEAQLDFLKIVILGLPPS